MRKGDYVSINCIVTDVFTNCFDENIVEVQLPNGRLICINSDMISLIKPATRSVIEEKVTKNFPSDCYLEQGITQC